MQYLYILSHRCDKLQNIWCKAYWYHNPAYNTSTFLFIKINHSVTLLKICTFILQQISWETLQINVFLYREKVFYFCVSCKSRLWHFMMHFYFMTGSVNLCKTWCSYTWYNKFHYSLHLKKSYKPHHPLLCFCI